MNSFEACGEAQLLAIEGQRQIADALASAVMAAFRTVLRALARQEPGTRSP